MCEPPSGQSGTGCCSLLVQLLIKIKACVSRHKPFASQDSLITFQFSEISFFSPLPQKLRLQLLCSPAPFCDSVCIWAKARGQGGFASSSWFYNSADKTGRFFLQVLAPIDPVTLFLQSLPSLVLPRHCQKVKTERKNKDTLSHSLSLNLRASSGAVCNDACLWVSDCCMGSCRRRKW